MNPFLFPLTGGFMAAKLLSTAGVSLLMFFFAPSVSNSRGHNLMFVNEEKDKGFGNKGTHKRKKRQRKLSLELER